jgi:hypothetical protein
LTFQVRPRAALAGLQRVAEGGTDLMPHRLLDHGVRTVATSSARPECRPKPVRGDRLALTGSSRFFSPALPSATRCFFRTMSARIKLSLEKYALMS